MSGIDTAVVALACKLEDDDCRVDRGEMNPSSNKLKVFGRGGRGGGRSSKRAEESSLPVFEGSFAEFSWVP